MSAPSSATLSDRGIVSVTGPDAEKLLQGLITNDISGLLPGTAAFAGLLSPQGKIQFDFFVVPVDGGYLLDVPRQLAPGLLKRLILYRLRSKADIVDRSGDFAVAACWGGASPRAIPGDAVTYTDPRLAALGSRSIKPAATSDDPDAEAAYHLHRITLGVPDGGRDYVYGDTFPHEALYDQLHGVSFTKGCYVGQEIVSRMEHRGTARKRVVMASAEQPLTVGGCDITAGGIAIGSLGSVAGSTGLALVRIDRAAEFAAKGVGLEAGGVAISLHRPAFATFAMETVPAQAPT